jgi:hypothetical protein
MSRVLEKCLTGDNGRLADALKAAWTPSRAYGSHVSKYNGLSVCSHHMLRLVTYLILKVDAGAG